MSSSSSHSLSSATHSTGSITSSAPTSITTTPAPGIVFTTIYPYGTPSPMPAPRESSPLPIASIAGGAAAGVALVIVVVIGWTCWGRRIKRKEQRKRDEEFAAIQVRENTRRNASTGTAITTYTPAFSARTEDRKVAFVSATPTLTEATAKKAGKQKELPTEEEKVKVTSEVKSVTPSSKPAATRAAKTPPTRIPFVFRNVERSDNLTTPPARPRRLRHSQQTAPVPSQAPDIPPLAHQASTMSSESMYSTQSGEERQRRVRSSLIMAALGHSEGRRSWFSNYFTIPTPHTGGVEGDQARISQVSSLSMYSQPDSGVGYAISGDDGAHSGRAV